MFVRTVLCLVFVLLARTPMALADEVSGSEGRRVPTPTLHGELGLSLADAIAMGIENNLDVQIQRHQPLIDEPPVRANR